MRCTAGVLKGLPVHDKRPLLLLLILGIQCWYKHHCTGVHQLLLPEAWVLQSLKQDIVAKHTSGSSSVFS